MHKLKSLFTGGSKAIQDKYKNPDELQVAMNKEGVNEDINFALFIDFTGSNNTTGAHTFDGKSLHEFKYGSNRYIDTIMSLKKFFAQDMDGHVAVYTYGTTEAWESPGRVRYHGSFNSVESVVDWYKWYSQLERVQQMMQGPTTLQYIIQEMIRIVQITGRYHIGVVLTDGDPDPNYKLKDIECVYTATQYAMSLVIAGIGDGVWDFKKKIPTFPFYEGLDDLSFSKMGVSKKEHKEVVRKTGGARFDGLQFINLEREILRGSEMNEQKQNAFFVMGFQEVPAQYKAIREKLKYVPKHGAFQHPAPEGWVPDLGFPPIQTTFSSQPVNQQPLNQQYQESYPSAPQQQYGYPVMNQAPPSYGSKF